MTNLEIQKELREDPKIKRIIPLQEIRDHESYWDLAELAEIFQHDVVECENGTWRWRTNKLVRLIMDYCPVYTPSRAESPDMIRGREGRASLNLNGLVVDVANGLVRMEEYMKFYMQMGYSLSGFCEVFGQSNAFEWNLPGAKTEHTPDQDPENYVETVIDYMRRIYKGKVLRI